MATPDGFMYDIKYPKLNIKLQGRGCGHLTFGADPEFFFQNEKGKVVGSEKILKQGGKEIKSEHYSSSSVYPTAGKKFSAFILDGVQVEMNTNAHACRQAMGIEIAKAFAALKTHLQEAEGGKVKACFANTIEVEKKEFDSLSEKSKEFGCAPSFNLYSGEARIGVDPTVYRKRSAGGHIHIGLLKGSELYKNRERLIPLMDCLVGLTCVLVDRDPGNKERRQVYGRAGEYRLPDHGIEYRTLSNFWLRSYPLMGLVLGLTRMAVYVLGDTLSKQANFERDLLDRMDMEKVVRAINENDFTLAKKLWIKGVKPFIENYTMSGNQFGLTVSNLKQFQFFVDMIDKKGIEYWFPKDPIDYWSTIAKNNNVGGGFEHLLACGVVYEQYAKSVVGG